MSEFRYRINDTRELVLTGEPLQWMAYDVGKEPMVWDDPLNRERAMFTEIERLRAIEAEYNACRDDVVRIAARVSAMVEQLRRERDEAESRR